MGNRYGNYQTHEEAEAALLSKGYERREHNTYTTYCKPSTDGFGFPMTDIVEITTGYVAARYTKSGDNEIYYQHHHLN